MTGERFERRDRGFGLVEVIVAMGLFGVLTTILLGFALGTGRVTEDARMLAGVNEESRLAMERFARELRQAREITAYTRAATPGDEVAFTFWTDFNGDNSMDRVTDLDVEDPEVLTYRWTPDDNQLTLSATDEDGHAVTRPVLAANVSRFEIELYSSLWEHDANGDGMTSWLELDAAVGGNNQTPEEADLELVDLVTVTMTVLDGPHRQTYRTEVDLRNRNQN